MLQTHMYCLMQILGLNFSDLSIHCSNVYHFVTDDEDEVARAIAIRFEEKGGVYYNNDDKINNEKVAVADITQYVAERTMSQYEEEFEVVNFSVLSKMYQCDIVHDV